jgi:hypothetical protein
VATARSAGATTHRPNATVELDADARANLIQALLGLTAMEMENMLAKAAVRERGFGPETARLVLDEKRALIRRTGALSFTPAIPIKHIGGYLPIRRLLRRVALTFSSEARAFGVEEAMGLLLCRRAHALQKVELAVDGDTLEPGLTLAVGGSNDLAGVAALLSPHSACSANVVNRSVVLFVRHT